MMKLLFIVTAVHFLQIDALLTSDQQGNALKPRKVSIEPVVIVHGGAGKVDETAVPMKIKGVKLAARLGYKTLMSSGTVLDAVESAVRSMELDEYFNAGYGSVLTWDGDVECDAAIMDGHDLNAGCVSIAKGILHPITLARRVMKKTRHNFMAGKGLMEFARKEGFDILPQGALVTERSLKALQDYKNSLNNKTNKISFRISSSMIDENNGDPSFNDVYYDNNIVDPYNFGEPGTVGAVAIDVDGNIAVATSTGGITGKLSGRIGDSPILGGGTYADNRYGGISVTGHGEMIMRFNVAQKVLQLINFKNLNAQEALEEVLNEMKERINGTAGAIVIDGAGRLGIYCTTEHMAWAYQKGEEVIAGIGV